MYLGVDGGGTKTAFVLIDPEGNVLAEHETPTCYHIQVGVDGARKVLEEGIKQTFEKAQKQVNELTYAFLGLPAFGEDSKVDAIVDAIPSSIIPRNKYHCDNDMVNGWAAAFGGQDGINIVAGTGSISYGVRGEHKTRCGGWGELFGDEGSAYWIGTKGLTAFSQMSDGRLRRGPLYNIIKEQFDIKHDLDISALVHTQWQGERTKIASVSILVAQAAEQGDKIALEIMREAGHELARIINSTMLALQYTPNETIKLSFSGGVFRSKSLILDPMQNSLQSYSPNFELSPPVYTPVIGAALYACQLSGNTMTKQALEDLMA